MPEETSSTYCVEAVWVAYKGWKKETFKFIISYWAKIAWQSLDLILEAFAILLLLTSGSVRGMSQGQLFGEVVCVLHHCAQALLEQHCSRSKRTTPYTGKQVQHRIRWISNSKCKLVIIEYPGPTSKQPWPMDFKEARIIIVHCI